MRFYKPATALDVTVDAAPIQERAELALSRSPEQLGDVTILRHPGEPREFYSEGDYWWPDPERPDGLPCVRRDGELNPEVFQEHRLMLRRLASRVGALAAGFDLTGREAFRAHALELLRSFLLDSERGMRPHLAYAQAIPGVCTGRSIGIIDSLHLIDLFPAIGLLEEGQKGGGGAQGGERSVFRGLRGWFETYADWLVESDYGVAERNEKNNHAIAWAVQVAGVGRLLEDSRLLELCRELYVERFLGEQMAQDGSFPREIARTRAYNYSIFALDNLVTLTHLLSSKKLNLWRYELSDGRGVRKGLDYLFPFLSGARPWPHARGLGSDRWLPVTAPFMLLASRGAGSGEWSRLWGRLPAPPADREIRRNIAIKEPYLYL